MEALTFKLEDFEGPLDLLLYLVSKNKMNLYDINIMELIDQYTAVIGSVQGDRMDAASEFIDMAAHLVQMKSALLLPRAPEAERMKAELTGRLIEYSACKQVAARLGSRARDLFTAVRAPQPLVGAAEYTRPHKPEQLVQAWYSLMGASASPARNGLSRWSRRLLSRWQAGWRICCGGFCGARWAAWRSCSAARRAAAPTWPPFWRFWSWCAPAGCRSARAAG